MNFTLDETQILLRDMSERLVRDNYDFEQRKKIIESPIGYSDSLWREYARLGLLGLEIDEKYGGSGRSFGDLALVLESFGRALVVEPYLPTVVLGAGLISRSGNDAQKEEFLPPIAAGLLKLAVAYGEPTSRFALDCPKTSATNNGRSFVLNGRKSIVIGGDTADYFVVSARTDRGLGLFIVPRDAEGLHTQTFSAIDDRRGTELTLDNVSIGFDNLLGPADGGLYALEAAIDRGVAALCCEAVGAMAALNELTLGYLKTRTQFGRPIGKFQALQHRMADMAIAEQQARSMALLAAEHCNNSDPVLRSKAISAAKVLIVHSSQIIGRGSIQLHGGIGLAMEYAAGHYFRRLTAIEIMFGDQSHHLARFASL